mmetsp:Transcript_34568/g.35243  ORF Transcript_34568/g.35243 Transcript_34568/m.35243 type:complete len:158 (+) Transcript_34568:134-607(+)
MSKGSLKKAAKAASMTSQQYVPIIITANILFLFIRVYWKYASFNSYHILGLILLGCLYTVSYAGLVSTAETNTSSSSYFDIFCITTATQIFACFSEWSWIILLAIPLYAVYSYLPLLFKSSHKGNVSLGTNEKTSEDVQKNMKASDRMKMTRLKKNH